jgi:hypothetical protein
LSEDINNVLSDLQKLHNKFRKEILNKISNTTPGKMSDDQFHAVVISARHFENDISKLIKRFKKTLK